MKKDYLEKTSIADGTEVRMFRNLRSYTNSVQMNIPNCEGKKDGLQLGTSILPDWMMHNLLSMKRPDKKL